VKTYNVICRGDNRKVLENPLELELEYGHLAIHFSEHALYLGEHLSLYSYIAFSDSFIYYVFLVIRVKYSVPTFGGRNPISIVEILYKSANELSLYR
jgi:hypothetical protein